MKVWKRFRWIGAVLIAVATGVWAGDLQYEQSYAHELFDEAHYNIMLESYENVVYGEGYVEEWSAAVPFVREMGDNRRPDFERYAQMNVNENPIAVLVSQFALAREGLEAQFSIPMDFRKLDMLPAKTIIGDLKEDADKYLAARMYLAAAAKLSVDSFLHGYYDPRICLDSHSRFWESMQLYLQFLAGPDPDFVHDYLESLLGLDFEISIWLWDSNIVARAATACLEGVDESRLIREIRYKDPETGEWVVRILRHSPEFLGAKAKGLVDFMHPHFSERLPRYNALCDSMLEKTIVHAEDFQLVAGEYLHGVADRHLREQYAEMLSELAAFLRGFLPRQHDAIAPVWNVATIYERHAKEYDRMRPNDTEGLSNWLRSHLGGELAQGSLGLNVHALRDALSDAELSANESLWSQWHLAMQANYGKALYFIHLARTMDPNQAVLLPDKVSRIKAVIARIEEGHGVGGRGGRRNDRGGRRLGN